MKISRWISTVLFSSLTLFAADWAQWRGPEFNGSSPEQNLPAEWEKEKVLWSTPMPGPSAATPAVFGNKVFVSSPDLESHTLHAICLDRKTGKVLWNIKTGDGISRDDRSNYASPSPVVDKDRVYFFYGTGKLLALTHSGKELWSRDITKDYGEFSFLWTFSSSPLLYNGKLYLQVLQRDEPVQGRGKKGAESYLLALNPESGKTLWRVVRPSDAVAESLEAFSTPVPFEHGSRREILITGGDCITGHDAATGKEIWRWGSWNPSKITHWRLVPSPVAGAGVILACAPKGSPVYAVKAGGKGTLTEKDLAWTSDMNREISSDVPTPLFYDGDFFVLNDQRRNLSRVEPATGKVKWTIELPGRKKYEASPTGADGKIYMVNFGGDVVVADAKDGKIRSTIAMGDEGDDMVRSTIAVAHGQLFIRTNKKLHSVGKN